MSESKNLKAATIFALLAIIVGIIMILCNCYYHVAVPALKLQAGAVKVYQQDEATMIVSEGYVQAAYVRWRRYLNKDAAQERLTQLCLRVDMDNKWTIKKSGLWEN